MTLPSLSGLARFVLAVGVAMPRAGWRLASVTGSVLLRAGGER